MESPYKSSAFRPWPARRKLFGKSPFGFCNKNLNEEVEAASIDNSRLNPDSDRLFELFWLQAAGQGHTSQKVILDFKASDFFIRSSSVYDLLSFRSALDWKISEAVTMSFFFHC